MSRIRVVAFVGAGVALVLGGSALAVTALADHPADARTKAISGFAEVPPKLSPGTGSFEAQIGADSITYTLTYSALTSPATVSHIHFGEPGVNGGVVAFLCGGGTKPACPPTGGTVTGTIVASDIIGIATPGTSDQGLAAGDLTGAIGLLEAGDGYVNVHSQRFPGGEIRSQIRVHGGDGQGDLD